MIQTTNADAYLQCLKENIRLVESADKINEAYQRDAIDYMTYLLIVKESLKMKDLNGKEISEERMKAYENELHEFQNRMNARKPNPLDYVSIDNFNHAMSEWNMAYHCDAPNKARIL